MMIVINKLLLKNPNKAIFKYKNHLNNIFSINKYYNRIIEITYKFNHQ